ncbi:hypothetical protein O6H91_05G108300 [Diphasiastrum complanatum]|uniref:Uncharacterized protein n=1 Tax=Diphasiastrum complanatum TaxID=34168 RepID=A0ACC2DRV2_DIPCM|nr:hypothetical protein O6H91_05G108300 [Diphasiastrum complanatum]
MTESMMMKIVPSCCWPPAKEYAQMESASAAGDYTDSLLWYRDIGKHAFGEFSIAAVQANAEQEDQSQIETGSYGTFVGVHDGHGGPDASLYINDHLFLNFQKFASEHGGMSSIVLQKAFIATEEGFLDVVARSWLKRPKIASSGSCSLVGVIWGDMLYVANLGDSRAILGHSKVDGVIEVMQLSTEHNASIEAVRQELQMLHPDDSHIVMFKQGVWRVKGIIQVSRSIGDVYLKRPEFNKDPLITRFRLSEPLQRPVLTAEPSIITRKLIPQDKFVIFASDGLWEHLTNQEAVDIVYRHPRKGVARRLINVALEEAARKREIRYIDLNKIDKVFKAY